MQWDDPGSQKMWEVLRRLKWPKTQEYVIKCQLIYLSLKGIMKAQQNALLHSLTIDSFKSEIL
jgi:hypothetical protein